jgi:hypothetical protein
MILKGKICFLEHPGHRHFFIIREKKLVRRGIYQLSQECKKRYGLACWLGVWKSKWCRLGVRKCHAPCECSRKMLNT